MRQYDAMRRDTEPFIFYGPRYVHKVVLNDSSKLIQYEKGEIKVI